LDGSEVETLVTDLQDPGNWEGTIGMQSGNRKTVPELVGCPLFHGFGGHMQPLCYGLGELFRIGFEKSAPDTAHGSRGMQVAWTWMSPMLGQKQKPVRSLANPLQFTWGSAIL